MLAKLSWKNIWRNKKRSLVLIISVILGLWAGVFVMGFYKGIMDQRIDDAIEKESSHIQIHHPKFNDEKLLKYAIEDADKIVDEITSMDSVRSVSARSKIQGMIASSRSTAGIQINGINPENEDKTTRMGSNIVEGNYFTGIKRNPILISKKTADKLKLKLRSKLVLTFQDVDNNITSALFRVDGIFKSSNGSFDEQNVFVRNSDIQKHLGNENYIHEIAILLKEHDNLNTYEKAIKSIYPDLEVRSWIEIIPGMSFMINSMDTALYVILWIIMLALLFGIVNTMLMAVLERTREIGMLMSIGMNKYKIFSIIIIETIFIIIIAGPLGMLLAYMTIKYYGGQGIDLKVIGEGLENMGYASVIYPTLIFKYYLNVLLQVIFMAFLGSIYPAFKALKLNPVVAIRKI